MLPMSSQMPTNQTPVRYSHVAHFVGLSLLRDPNLARSKRVTASKSASMPQLSQASVSDVDDFPSQSLSSKPSLPVERVDQLRCQINWLKAERRAENEQLKKLQHSLSDSVRAESLVHERSNQQRKKRDQHEQQLVSLKDDMQTVKSESRRRELAKTWPDSSRPGSPSSADNHQAVTRTADAASVDDVRPLSPPQMRAATPPVDRNYDYGAEVRSIGPGKASMPSRPRPTGMEVEMFDSEEALAKYRRDVVRKELLARVERRADPSGQLLGGRAVNYFELKRGLIDQKLPDSEVQSYWEQLETVQASNPLEAFKLINLNGSGRICSNEFADGVTRVGVHWQKLTGIRQAKHLFRLFDLDHTGVITLFELFPTERHVKKIDTGSTTPEFWKTYVNGNRAESFFLDCPKGRNPPWNTGVADNSLAIMHEREGKDNDAKDNRHWMKTTMRRLKGRGKSDARVREMCCTHLPRGTGPKDRQEVSTFSDIEVKQCRKEYNDAVMEPQRTVLKALYDLRETRKELATSRHKLWTVAMEPLLKQQAAEAQAAVANSSFGGLNLLHRAPVEEPVADRPASSSKPAVSADLGSALGSMTPF